MFTKRGRGSRKARQFRFSPQSVTGEKAGVGSWITDEISGINQRELAKQNEAHAEKYKKDNEEIARLQLKGVENLTAAEKVKLELLTGQLTVKKKDAEIEGLLKKGVTNLTDAEKERLNALTGGTVELEKQVNLTKGAKTASDSWTESMGKLFDEVSNISKAWEDFKGSVTSFGRGDKELSARELARKRGVITQDIFQREDAARRAGGSYQTFDPFLGQQRYNLAQLQGEESLRSQARQAVKTFGEERAFGMFNFTEQRWADILRTAQDQSESTDILREIEDGQRRGFAALSQSLKDGKS